MFRISLIFLIAFIFIGCGKNQMLPKKEESVKVVKIKKTIYKKRHSDVNIKTLAFSLANHLGVGVSTKEVKEDILSLVLKDDFVKISMKAGFVFPQNSYKLTFEAINLLDLISKELKKYPNLIIEIAGHSDNSGNYAYNYRLSERRALSIKDILLKGLKNDFLTTGCSFKKPLFKKADEYTLSLNRRVEIFLFKDIDDVFDVCK